MGLHLGFHRYTITPPNGIDMTGYGGREGPAVGVLDDLVLDAVAFREGDKGLLWLNADLLSFATDHVQRIRHQIEATLGVPPERVALCATHTHAGPAVPTLRDLGDPDPSYISFLERWAVSASKHRLAERQPGHSFRRERRMQHHREEPSPTSGAH